NSLEALIHQGLFHDSLMAPATEITPLGRDFGIATGKSDPFQIALPDVLSRTYPDAARFRDPTDEERMRLAFAYFTTETEFAGGIAYASLLGRLDQEDEEDVRKSPGHQQNLEFHPVLSVGVAKVYTTGLDITLMPEAHILYRYENADEVRAGIGVSV